MILDTAISMYKYFLSEVRKEKTVVITPQQWMEIINSTSIDWMKTKMPEREFNQKRFDDLESVKVLTNGHQYPVIQSLPQQDNVFAIPYDSSILPKYMFGLSVAFYYTEEKEAVDPTPPDNSAGVRMAPKADIDNPVPDKDVKIVKDVIGGLILRSDMRVVYKNNPYRKLNDNESVYFEQRGNYIYCLPNKERFNRMILEYYRYPTEIVFDGTNGHVGSFMPMQNKEISDMAVTKYLERVSDQRLQSQPVLNSAIPK